MPAAVRTASWPAPEIWKKIRFWRLSWISLSSRRRDRSIVRYAPRSCSLVSPAVALRSLVEVAMSRKIDARAESEEGDGVAGHSGTTLQHSCDQNHGTSSYQ